MPLKQGKSEKTFRDNVRELVAAGHPLRQALAIAFKQKGEKQKR